MAVDKVHHPVALRQLTTYSPN